MDAARKIDTCANGTNVRAPRKQLPMEHRAKRTLPATPIRVPKSAKYVPNR
jgi:hypothetical protein